MLVNEIVSKIRFKVADEDVVQYTNDNILQVINEAHRFIMGIYLDEYPDILADDESGTLAAGSNSISLEAAPLKIVDLRCNGKRLHFANISEIVDTEMDGDPKFYCVRKEHIKVFPIPQKSVSYDVSLVYETDELGYSDSFPYPADFIDYLIEFSVIRLQTVDGASVSMETSIFAELRNKIISHIKKLVPDGCVVESYY